MVEVEVRRRKGSERGDEKRSEGEDTGRDRGEMEKDAGRRRKGSEGWREGETKCRSRRKMKRKKEGRWLTNGHRVQTSQRVPTGRGMAWPAWVNMAG